MSFAAIDTLRVLGNNLGGGGGCFVPLVSNVSTLAVQSSGVGCPTPLTIPVPWVSASGGGSQEAVELTAWGDGGMFAKAVLVGSVVHHVIPAQGVRIAVASEGGSATLDTTAQFPQGSSLSFTAVPMMKHDDATTTITARTPHSERSLLGALARGASSTVGPRLGVAKKHPSNPLLVQDRPWEPRIDNGYPSLVRLPGTAGAPRYMLFYDGYTTGAVGCSGVGV